MPDVPVTEFTDLDPDSLHLVKRGANGFPALLAKAVAEEIDAVKADVPPCPQCEGCGKIREGHVKCPKCGGSGKLVKAEDGEAGEILDDIIAGTAKGLCDDDGCPVCAPLMEKGKLKAAARNKLADSDFAVVDSKGKRKLPIHDQPHVQSAMGRFGQTQFESDKQKSAAAGKIQAKAKSLGMDVDPKSDVAQAAKSTGVPDDATATPQVTGVDSTFAHSGQRMAEMANGIKPNHASPSLAVGGESTYIVIGDDVEGVDPPAAMRKASNAAWVATSLFEALEHIQSERDAAKKDGTSWLQMDNPQGAAATQIGSGPWESYDSATLTQVAQQLAACGEAISAIEQREVVEAAAGNAGDILDTWALADANSCLDTALGIVARLAFHEGASATKSAEEAIKVGRKLSGKTETSLRAARDHLTDVLGDGAKNTPPDEETDMATMTKEELAELVAGAAKSAALEAVAEDRKARKAAKAERASKNANNGGDITAEQLNDGVKGKTDANDIAAVKAATDDEAISLMKQMGDQLKAQGEQLTKTQELVSKFAARPRPGGPILDGQPRGVFPASEGRLSDGAAKGAGDSEVTRLEKAYAEAKDPVVHDNLGMQLAHARILAAHNEGAI